MMIFRLRRSVPDYVMRIFLGFLILALPGISSVGPLAAGVTHARELTTPPRPTNLAPPQGAILDTLTPTLTCSPYAGTQPEKAAVQWQVDVNSMFTTPRFDSGPTSAPLASITLPRNIMRLETTFWWRVRQRDSAGQWSAWSNPTSFTMSDVIPSERWGNFFPPRSASVCLNFMNKLWVIGPKDAWSSADGRSWKFRAEMPVPLWPSPVYWPETGSGGGGVTQGKMWVLGMGSYNSDSRMHLFTAVSGVDWIETPMSRPPSLRTGFSCVSFQNRMWMIGGMNSKSKLNDVWSSVDGITWTTVTAHAGFTGRYGHASVVFGNRIWVIGGANDTKVLNDVWSSADGAVWRQETAAAAFPARYKHACAVLSDRIWLIGGNAGNGDVWSSADGITWRQETNSVPFGERENQGIVAFNGRLWGIAGRDGVNDRNDCWSSADGVNWRKETGITCIQEEIDHAAPGAEIIMPPGRYEESIDIYKDVNLHSQDPINPAIVTSTLISKSKMYFSGGVTASCRLAGFSIENMKWPVDGNRSKAIIERNIFKNNSHYTTLTFGTFPSPPPGAVGGALLNCDGVIQNNYFQGNIANTGGALGNCNGVIQNNIFLDNRVCDFIYEWEYEIKPGFPFHGTVYCSGSGSAIDTLQGIIRNNTFVTSDYHSIFNNAMNAKIYNNIIWSSDPSWQGQINSQAIVRYNCIRGWTGGGTGNISADPRFADAANGNYHLRADSPCIDAGMAAAGLTTDFDGNPRGVRGTTARRGDGSLVDIGAYEYQPPKTHVARGQWALYE